MSYTKDAQGNIVRKPLFSGWRKKEMPPAIPEPEQETLKPSEYFELILKNQQEIYGVLLEIKQNVDVIKDDSVEEASDKYKKLLSELQEKIKELDEKKGKKK